MKRKSKQIEGLKGSYVPFARLGSGGFSQAWQAKVTKIKKSSCWIVNPGPKVGDTVVVKWANIEKQYSDYQILDFINDVNHALNTELTALKQLAGLDSIPRVFDIANKLQELEGGMIENMFVIVEEYVQGHLLDSYLMEKYSVGAGEQRKFSGIDDCSRFFDLAIRLASIVREIHRRGVLHGDIWHRNVKIDQTDKLRILDFGSAAFRHTTMLRPGTFEKRRSDPFCAPEVRNGQRHGRRSDIYSLGCLLYFMSTGELPPDPVDDIEATKNSVLSTMKRQNPNLLVSNCGIADVIARCLRYAKDKRIRDADALLAELRLFSFSDDVEDKRLADECIQRMTSSHIKLDSLFARMFLKFSARCQSMAEDMKDGIHELSGDHDELVFEMTTYLSVLERGDMVLARTMPRFWKQENMGINGRFLSMLRLIAQKGVIVRHLMFIPEDAPNNNHVKQILESHLEALQQASESTRQNLQFFCQPKLPDQPNWETCYEISGETVKAVQPVYDSEDRLRTIRFIREKAATASRLKKEMEDEIKHGGLETIERWLSSKRRASGAA